MLNRSQFWILTSGGVIALLLVLVNMVLYLGNRELQDNANGRSQYIQQSIALEGLYREIVQNLANRAVQTRDDQVRDLLAAEGINVNFPPAADTAKGGGR
jgi:hypothetical protein